MKKSSRTRKGDRVAGASDTLAPTTAGPVVPVVPFDDDGDDDEPVVALTAGVVVFCHCWVWAGLSTTVAAGAGVTVPLLSEWIPAAGARLFVSVSVSCIWTLENVAAAGPGTDADAGSRTGVRVGTGGAAAGAAVSWPATLPAPGHGTVTVIVVGAPFLPQHAQVFTVVVMGTEGGGTANVWPWLSVDSVQPQCSTSIVVVSVARPPGHASQTSIQTVETTTKMISDGGDDTGTRDVADVDGVVLCSAVLERVVEEVGCPGAVDEEDTVNLSTTDDEEVELLPASTI